jgi:hypothetical protein
MKVLFLTRDYSKRTDAYTLYLPFQQMLKHSGVDVINVDAFVMYGDSYEPDILNGKIIKQNVLNPDYINDKYDIVVGENFFPYFYEDWDSIQAKRVIWLEDIHGYCPKWLEMVKNRIGLDGIFTHYLHAFHENYDEENVYHLPHSISPSVHKDYELEKTYHSLLTGAIGESVYPLRWKIFKELENKEYFKRIERPQNRLDKYPDSHPYGSKYCKHLNMSVMSFASTSIFKYTIAKLFEIPACNSLLLSDFIPEMKELGFIPNENFIEIDMDTDINELIMSLSSEHIQNVTKKGYEFVHKNHSVKVRCEQFLEYCKEIKECR